MFFLYIAVIRMHSLILGIKAIFVELLMSYGSGRGYSGGFNRSFSPKPVETGKEYDVQITETSRRGDGIARIQGFVIFVKNGQVGQNVKAKIIQVGERFATAEVV
jgi:predicted RNA-binding protein with TRAM domain